MRAPAAVAGAVVRARTAARRTVDVAGWQVLAAGGAALAALVSLLVQLPRLADRYDAALRSGAADPAAIAALHADALAGERRQLVLAVVLLVVVGLGAVLLVRRLLGPVRAVTGAAERFATVTVPALDAPGPDDDTGPRGMAVGPRAPADVTALVDAVVAVQADVTALARRQHDRARQRSELAVHLERRNNALLNRVATQADVLQSGDCPPTVLADLARLGHMVTRAQRHAESMLVLSGAVPDRIRLRAAAMADVVRAALAGVEDHARVDPHQVEPAAVTGTVVPDLAHLLGELVENAAHFSPPDTRVGVSGAPAADGDGYRLRVVDHGVGMAADQLDEANDRIRRAASGTPASKLVGLDVVGRLAARHGITVVLAHGEADGVVATVTVPAGLLAPVTELPVPRRPVSALVAAAAFRPPRAGAEPVAPSVARPRRSGRGVRGPAAAETAFVRPGVPRRVKGAQLPDLGPDREEGPHVVPDAGRVQGRLHALQSGLDAARTNNIPPLPRPLPGPAPNGDD